jgi:riboflavin biosynthesis pyrimidine reductase
MSASALRQQPNGYGQGAMSSSPDAVVVPPVDTADGTGQPDQPDPFETYEAERPRPDGRPWLIANMVAGLDGSLAWRGRVGALSSAADRSLFVRLRGLADAVVVGAGTVRAEGYGPVKLPDERREQRLAAGRQAVPPVVVVSRSLALDWDGPIWKESTDQRPILVTAASAPPGALDQARRRADVIVAGDDSVDLAAAMAALAERGMAVVLTEGGPTLLAELVAEGLLDELCLTLTPLFGGDPLTMAHRSEAAVELRSFSLDGVVRREDELYLRYLLRRDDEEETGR